MKHSLILLVLLATSTNAIGAAYDQFNGYPIVFCDDNTQSCKNIARSDAQRIANLGGTPYYFYYGLNFSTAVLEKYQMTVIQEPGDNIVFASNTTLDAYAAGYANDLIVSFDNLNDEIAVVDPDDLIAGAGFSIEFSLISSAYADPLECPTDPDLQSASDYALDNEFRTRSFQENHWLNQNAAIFMTKVNNLLGAIGFSSQTSTNAARLAGGGFDFGVTDLEFPNGDRAKVTVDPQGRQWVVIPGSIIDCNGQLYPEELRTNVEFEFSTTESLHDFARYFSLDDVIAQYNIKVNPSYVWACTKTQGGGWVCVRRMK